MLYDIIMQKSLVFARNKRRVLMFWQKLLDADLWPARFYIALSSIVWSILLFWPGDTFGRPTYTIMSHIASEMVWATMFGIVGICGLITLYFDIRNRVALFFDAAFSCVLWTSSCAAMLMSVYPVPAAISAEITTAMLSWWILANYPTKKSGYSDSPLVHDGEDDA